MTVVVRWTDAETALLRSALHVDGKSYAEAAMLIGRSRAGVRKKAKVLGYCAAVDGRKHNGNTRTFGRSAWWLAEDRTHRLRSAVAAGHKYTIIAAMLGTTKNAVIGRAYRLGLSRRSKPYVPPRYPFNEIGPRDCCWPFGDPDQPDFRFCGRRAQADRPYCAEHMLTAYLPPR